MKTQNNATIALRKVILGLAVLVAVGSGILAGANVSLSRFSAPVNIADGQETHGLTPTTEPIQHNA